VSDSDDRPFMVFSSEEDMQLEAKRRLILKLNLLCSQNYPSSNKLKDFFRNIDSSCIAKTDIEFLDLYNSKLKEQEAKDIKEKEDKLQKELDEITAKQKQIELEKSKL
jgi:hypothetical protein